MKDFKISELAQMQNALKERMAGKWLPLTPENGHFSLLWMFEEMGELVAVIKKRGGEAIMEDAAVRAAFTEELSDVLMYFMDLLACYGITPDELCSAFEAKHTKNMARDFVSEHAHYLQNEE